jgi:hypothetical protein
MDPDANLRRQLAIARAAVNIDGADETLVELSELVLALDEWIRGSGFTPSRWGIAQ